jgi:hypothetical protein
MGWFSIIGAVAVPVLTFLVSWVLVFFVMLYKESLLDAEAEGNNT